MTAPRHTLRLPLGYDNFGTFIDKKFNFVDKSLFIQEILDDSAQAIVLTRPRRFGKTTALSMLQYFFAPEVLGHSTKGMFDNLKIAALGDTYMQHQGQYPVIFLSLKEIGANSMALSLDKISKAMSDLYREHQKLLHSKKLTLADKKAFQVILDGCFEPTLLQASFKDLGYYLYIHHGVKPWVLLDEYDSPLHAAYAVSAAAPPKNKKAQQYFDDMVGFMRGLLGGLLKTNPYLERAVLTGILRISKESMFSGLNNIKIYSILSNKYTEHFGFTQEEVNSLLEQSHLLLHQDAVKKWYNGYQFGATTIYNPWSINNFIHDGGVFDTYWVNTSDNQLLYLLLNSAPLKFKIEFEQLLAGGSTAKDIDENLVFRYLHQDSGAIWSLLLFTGYLKPISITKVAEGNSCELVIPNQEVRQLYHKIIARWLADGEPVQLYTDFIKSLIAGDMKTFEHHLSQILLHVVSYHDFAKEPEAFYHGLMLGFTASLSETYILQSNREAGIGRFDILLLPRDPQQLGIIIELKIAQSKTAIKKAAEDALAQIETREYQAVLAAHKTMRLLKIGIGFRNKQCALMSSGTIAVKSD